MATEVMEATKRERSTIPVYKCSFVWELENLKESLSLFAPGDHMESESFSHPATPDILWRLKIYPGGLSEKDEGHLSLFLELVQSPQPKLKAAVTLQVGDAKDSFVHVMAINANWGETKLLAHAEAEKLDSHALGQVKATVEYQWGQPGAFHIPPAPAAKTPPDDSFLFLKEHYADVMVKVFEARFPAHRLVLAKHSVVLECLFAAEEGALVVEGKKRKGILEINLNGLPMEAEAAKVAVRHFLSFLYTGHVEEGPGAGPVDAEDLFVLAGSYDVYPLKTAMETQLCQGLNAENFCRLARFAYLNEANRLLGICQSFVRAHGMEMDATEWDALEKDYPKLVCFLLRPVPLR